MSAAASFASDVELPELEAVCARCEGKGGEAEMYGTGWCNCLDCDGTGYLPTPLGQRILALVRHNSRLKIRAELEMPSVN